MIKLCKDCKYRGGEVNYYSFENGFRTHECDHPKSNLIDLETGEKLPQWTKDHRPKSSNAALGICGADGIYWEGKE